MLRILVPLTIEKAQIERGLKIIADCFSGRNEHRETGIEQNTCGSEVRFIRE
ncbi:hypothetical protein MJ390_06295 [Klebsiella pneumoniae]|nr:hypothetical protein MJ390_06295 [Klebsiella pneumoniae]